jgi:outer membrane protein
MKKAILLLSLLFPLWLSAQKFGYVDSKYILGHIQAYQDAQADLDKMSMDWQKEIEQKYEGIEKMEKAYQAEKILLTDEMKKKRESELEEKRKEARELQKKRFGVEGDLFKKREELIKPIQDDIYTAIQDVASQGGLMVVFDKANQSNILYSNPKHDISDKVLKKMGLKPGDTTDGGEEQENTDEAPKGNTKGAGGVGGKSDAKSTTAPKKRP